MVMEFVRAGLIQANGHALIFSQNLFRNPVVRNVTIMRSEGYYAEFRVFIDNRQHVA